MLRVEICDSAETLILKLEGRFTDDDAEHTRTLAARFAARGKLLVDLTEVVFIDAVGEEVLSFLGQFGAQFVAPNSYVLDVCERLNLRVAPNGSSYLSALGEPLANGAQSGPNRSKSRKKVTTSEPEYDVHRKT
jgi:hypothetical protein